MTSIHHIILSITELSREKIRFIKWILKSIKLYPDIQVEVPLTMIDSEIIDYKDKLHRANLSFANLSQADLSETEFSYSIIIEPQRKDKLIVTITLLLTFEYVFHADHDRFKKLNLSYLYHCM